MAQLMHRVVLPVTFGLAVLVVWQGVIEAGMVSKLVLTGPVQIVTALITEAPTLLSNGLITLTEAVSGFVLGSLAGLATAALFIRFGALQRAVFPLTILMEAVPVVAILPVLMLWMGNGMAPKIFIAAFLSFFPMLVNAYRGFSNVDADVQELMLSYSASPEQLFWKVRLPAALPFMFTALKLSACSSIVSALVAEWLASDQGLGYLIISYGQGYRVADVWAAATLACLLALAFYGITAAGEKWALSRRTR
ncbi:ABC transporter permease [Jiella sp. MQZ9-1]|uniref:ABC transporter permease n=1 Tax=Jiella flava TaxID=2816857 RepID=A0A939JXN9_9HYPH|nr:ABC transporter permease [Jiella flava]MBO0664282.1 ABC transporter permease [Jiella flava]MCD2472795.1 ABC transporter permease [Jiella flava]